MKSLIFAALAVFSVTAMAEGEEVCKKISAIAGKDMEARQNGVLLEDAMTRVEKQGDFAKAMVMRAYASPIQDTEEGKQREISEHRNVIYAECYNAHN